MEQYEIQHYNDNLNAWLLWGDTSTLEEALNMLRNAQQVFGKCRVIQVIVDY